ncbi:MAG: FkbM family methyltransferase [Bacteroidetes bacterium]|nr:FkbM family methyltransferase [Bacteroidota bacterium]
METFRQVVRNILKPDSNVYKFGATALDFLSTMKTDGYKTWCTMEELRKGSRDNPPQPVSLRKLEYPILIRPGTSDAHTIINNVVREEYGQVNPTTPPKWMIDAGAYTGDTTAYFLSRFPGLKIIALEPNPPSYKIAKMNLEPYGERAILLQKGLYVNDGVTFFSGDGTGASIDKAGFKIDCTTVSSLMEQYSIPRIDILKMDIEGAEEAIFSSDPEKWLSSVNMLMIEIHGSHIIPLIARVLSENGFSMKQYRSIWYCQSGKK